MLDKGEVLRTRDGRPVPNPSPPVCAETPCWNPKRRRLRPRFTAYDFAAYRRFRLCRALGCTPRPGALSEQDPWELRRYDALVALFDGQDREAQSLGMLSVLKLLR